MAEYHLTNSYGFKCNCGFARCAIRELTPKGRHAVIDKQQRMLNFQDLFKDCPNYGLSSAYFEDTSKGRESTFDRHCDKINESWSKKWHPQEKRSLYSVTFAVSNWKALPMEKKLKHTLSCCQECYIEHGALQMCFPLKPHYMEQPIVSVNVEKLEKLGKKEGTRTALTELNDSFNSAFQKTFVESLVSHGDERLQVSRVLNLPCPLCSFNLPLLPFQSLRGERGRVPPMSYVSKT